MGLEKPPSGSGGGGVFQHFFQHFFQPFGGLLGVVFHLFPTLRPPLFGKPLGKSKIFPTLFSNFRGGKRG